jgi:type I restriction enzyme S subunit
MNNELEQGERMKKGWEIKKLGDVCNIVGGGTPSKSNPKFYTGGDVLWATVRDMKCDVLTDTEWKISAEAVTKSATNIIPRGNVIIATRVGLGKVCLLACDTAINQDLKGIIPKKPNTLQPLFLFHWLKLIAEKIIKNGTGATVQGVKIPFIESLNLPIPPLPEQHRIVSILDESFAAIAKAKENAEKNLANAREVFESYLREVFVYKSKGTNCEPLENLCELIVDCEPKTAPTQGSGYPSIRTPNIGKGVLILDDVNRVSEKTYLEWTRRAIPQAGDLILAREAPAGNVAIIPEDLKVCLGQRTVLIRPLKEKLNSKYLAFLLLSKDVQEILLSNSRGATVTHVNMKDIRAFKIFDLLPFQNKDQLSTNSMT